MSAIADAQLRRALRVRAGDALAQVTRLEWDSYIAEADRSWKPIGDLSGLEACRALVHVGLVGNHVTDLAPLEGLEELVEVWLSFNGGPLALGPLANKAKLRVLELSSCGVSELEALWGDRALVKLGLDDNRVTSLAPLAGLDALERLDVGRNQVAEVAPLRELVALQELRLADNPIVDVAPLAGLVALRELDLRNTRVADLRMLATQLPALKDLRIAGAPAAADAETLAAFRARGVRIDGVGSVGAAAAWTVTPLALTAFRR